MGPTSWMQGEVLSLWYQEKRMPAGHFAPYQVKSIIGTIIAVPEDTDEVIRRLSEPTGGEQAEDRLILEKVSKETAAERAERERRNVVFLAKRGNFDAIRQFNWPCVDVRDDEGFSVLHWAALGGDLDAAKWLLESHADPDVKAANLPKIFLARS